MPETSSFPKLDLTTFILSVSSAAFMGLGVIPPGREDDEENPGDAPRVNLELARQNIDLLELIQEKTKGNRTPEEDRLLEQLLFETRMRYIEVQRRNK